MAVPNNQRLRVFGHTFNISYIHFFVILGTLATCFGCLGWMDPRMVVLLLIMMSVAMRVLRR